MIIKIAARGHNPYGLVNYMLGPGRHNEHTEQHTICGSVHYVEEPSKDLVAQISADLRAYAKANPQIDPKTKHIWQASLSLHANEGTLSDGRWAQIAQDYMAAMKFTDPAKSPVRWTVFRHGSSTEGNDHIHIVMSTIREDGSRVNIHNDAPRSQRAVAVLEREHGLQVIPGRGSGARPVPFTGGEKGKAHDNNHEIERVELERRIRGLATASASEAEFVRRVRGAGLEIRPRTADGAVTGYSVSMPGAAAAGFAGGKLARDLTLPRLRQRWAEPASGVRAAEMEWLHGRPLNPLIKQGREVKNRPVPPEFVQRELAGVQQGIAGADAATLREIAADLSGVLSLGAAADPSLAAASRDAGRWAQTEQYEPRGQQRFLNTGLLMLQLMDPNGPVGHAVMLRQVLSTLQTMYEAHRARCTEVLSGKEHQMTTAQADGIDEAAEGLAVVGVTVGARAVQTAIQNRQIEQLQQERAGRQAVVKAPPAQQEMVPASQREPQDWKTAAEPMTPAQRWRIEKESRDRGINPDEAMPGWRQWDKATASGAITEYAAQEKQQARTAVMLTPETRAPVDARAYEGPGIAAGESVTKNQGRGKY